MVSIRTARGLACALALAAAAPAVAAPAPGRAAAPTPPARPLAEVVVKLKPGRAPADLAERLPGRIAASLRPLAGPPSRAVASPRRPASPGRAAAPRVGDIYRLRSADGESPAALAARLAADPAVEYAAPARLVRVFGDGGMVPAAPPAQAIPNDPYLSSSGSWGQPYRDLWGMRRIKAVEAWDVAKGAGVVVAVVDTGVDLGHEDLAANAWVNAGEVPGDGVDNDGNGYVDDVHGWDFVGADVSDPAPDADPADGMGHGTHVAGTVAAVAGNGVGVAGVAPQARVMAVKGLDDAGWGADVDLAAAIVYAADNGADVINNSWGGQGDSPVVSDAVAYALARGCVVVAAAGNDARDAAGFRPANVPGVIAVAATDRADAGADFSNHGGTVAVAAPGGDSAVDGDPAYTYENILSLRAAGTDPYGDGINVVGERYYRLRGTSMASPHVAGAAALVLSRHPAWTAVQVERALRQTADPVVDDGRYLGSGRINALKAASLARVSPAVAAVSSPAWGSVVSGRIDILGTVADPRFARYELFHGVGNYPAAWTRFHASVKRPTGGVLLAGFDTALLKENRLHTLKLVVTDTRGLKAVAYTQVNVDNVRIEHPLPGDVLRAGGVVPVTGTVDGGRRFIVETSWRDADGSWGPWNGEAMTPENGGALPLPGDAIATWDSGAIAEPGDHRIRVTSVREEGKTRQSASPLHLDPSLKPGWPLRVPWYPVPEGSLIGGGGQGLVRFLVDPHGRRVLSLPRAPAGSTARVAFRNRGRIAMLVVRDGRIVGDPRGWSVAAASAGAAAYYFGGALEPVAVDADGDGKRELFVYVGGEPPRLHAYRDDGTLLPGFPAAVPGVAAGWNLTAPSAADLDGDGDLELVVNSSSWDIPDPDLFAFHHDGTPLWQADLRLGDQPSGETVVADLDGDGVPEVARRFTELAHDYFGEKLALLDAAGRVLPGWPRETYNFADGKGGYASSIALGFVASPAAGDIDGDGEDEIVVASSRNQFDPEYDPAAGLVAGWHVRGRVFAFRKDGSDVPGFPRDLPGALLVAPALADLDGDGRKEIAVAVGDLDDPLTPPATHLIDGSGSDLPGWPLVEGADWAGVTPVPTTLPDGTRALVLVSDSVRSDDDLVGEATVRLVDRLGRTLAGWPRTVLGVTSRGPVVGDVDGDGAPEIVLPTVGLVHCLRVDGDACAGFPKVTDASIGDTGPTIADLDGDGRGELAGGSAWDEIPATLASKLRGSLYLWDLGADHRPAAGDWPMAGHDPAHTSCAP